VGLVLDLAVVALAVAVTVSLALLAWTLGVGAVAAARRATHRAAAARAGIAELEVRLHDAADEARIAIEELAARARLDETSRGR
jgi:hypothetical protein